MSPARKRRRGRTVLYVVALVCAVGAVTSAALVRPPRGAAAAAANPAPPLPTPLWSPRRVPTLFAEPAARARFASDLARAVAPFDACVAVNDGTGPLARIGGDRTLAPASSMKLLTAAAAIATLGPEYRFTTRVVRGPGDDLVVVGGGDPLLASPPYAARQRAQLRYRNAPYTDLGALADAIAAAGVRQVGALVVDDRRHDSLRFLPAWKPNYAPEGEVGALGALAVDGGFADLTHRTPAADPAIATGQQLAVLLGARGVMVAGGIRRGAAAPDAREVAHVDSAPLGDVVGEMLNASDNFTGEQVLREIAVRDAHGAPATTEMGAATVVRALDTLRIPHSGILMLDGSGLAPGDRVGCPTLLGVIELTNQSRFAAIDRGLPVAGRSGTLAGRFLGDRLAGVLRAKTGSIDDVVALAGTVDAGPNPDFAFIANGAFSPAGGSALQAAVAHAVASYPSHIDTAELVPAP